MIFVIFFTTIIYNLVNLDDNYELTSGALEQMTGLIMSEYLMEI